jgi:hypothetical protein
MHDDGHDGHRPTRLARRAGSGARRAPTAARRPARGLCGQGPQHRLWGTEPTIGTLVIRQGFSRRASLTARLRLPEPVSWTAVLVLFVVFSLRMCSPEGVRRPEAHASVRPLRRGRPPRRRTRCGPRPGKPSGALLTMPPSLGASGLGRRRREANRYPRAERCHSSAQVRRVEESVSYANGTEQEPGYGTRVRP